MRSRTVSDSLRQDEPRVPAIHGKAAGWVLAREET